MSCLFKFKWVKLLREHLPDGKGIMSDWAKLASRVAFRKGKGYYCGHQNDVNVGTWVGGIMGIKSILGVKSKSIAIDKLNMLQELGYIDFEIEKDTKKLTLSITDWVMECCGKECLNDNVYATNDYGFLCVPRDITERLVEVGYKFEEADAWLDLWVHTVYEDKKYFSSFFAPETRFEKMPLFLTLEALSKRWGWEKTKTWRFFQKYKEVFVLKRLPGTYGCLIFNRLYPTQNEIEIPSNEKVREIFSLIIKRDTEIMPDTNNELQENRVALFTSIIRAYISPYRCKTCVKDCKGNYISNLNDKVVKSNKIRGPCEPFGCT